MNTNYPAHQGEGHGPPPGVPLTDEQVLIKAPDRQRAFRAVIEERAATIGSTLYMVIAQELGDDPLELVRLMVSGRYRWKRHRNQHLWVDTDGNPVPECMSLRQAAAELVRLTRRDVSHEALRRWWDRIWPGDEPNSTAHVPPVTFTPPHAA